MQQRVLAIVLCVAACGGGSASGDDASGGGDDAPGTDAGGNGTSPRIGGCDILPADHIFNTPIADMPFEHDYSDMWVSLIGGTTKLHLDLGTNTDPTTSDFYGIPYNLVHGTAMTWSTVAFTTPDPDFDWDPQPEADCGNAQKGVVSPCTGNTAYLPFPSDALVEGGLSTAANHLPAEDHHLIALDVDSCRLWEGYHVYRPNNQWQIFGAATFDLASSDLRPADWTSADAAGFPILPLLLKASEASTGTIAHALRFTILSSKIRASYVWPARHLTGNATSQNLPQMGQLFRLKSSYQIPANYNVQAKAILQALKTYGMYIADGGSDMYIQGEPNASWLDATFTQVQSVSSSQFEAVDILAITSRPGFNMDSGAVPPQ